VAKKTGGDQVFENGYIRRELANFKQFMEGFSMSSETGGGLCISRHAGQSFTIGESTTIEVVEIRGDKVRLRIVAPKELEILRDNAINKNPKV